MSTLVRICRVAAWLAPVAWVVAVAVVTALAMRHPGGHPSGPVLAIDASVQLAKWLGAAGLVLAATGLVATRSAPGEGARLLAVAALVNAVLAGAAWVLSVA